jgi:septal ring factor EnvC (AmiA/AmiB activator)
MLKRASLWRTLGVSLALVLAARTVGAQPSDRTQAEALSRRAADRLQALRQEAEALAARERTLLGDLRRLELDREIKVEELQRAAADVTTTTDQIGALDRQVQQLEDEEIVEGPRLRARMVSLYKLGRGRYVRLLLSTSNLRQLGQAARTVAAVAAADRQRVAVHERRMSDLAASRAALVERQQQLSAARERAARAKAASDRAVEARNALIREIDDRRDLNARLSGELEAAQQKLQATLTALASGAAAVEPASLPIGPFRGALGWPVDGAIRQRFGHGGTAVNGIDIAAEEGSPVHAVHDGTVAFADAFAGFGRLVIVDHGAQTFSLYGNLAALEVEKGARIQQGQRLGRVGVAPTGAAGLYFELRVEGHPVDPLLWLQKK